MGLLVSPDIFQEKMSELMAGLEFARAYLDDLLIIVKNFFGRTNLEYLGYNTSREGICPSQKKVDAILQIKPPSTGKQLRRFIGMVNYYRDMWPLRSHLLAFEKMKVLIAKETLLPCPDFSQEFKIHTDASKLQLGACISQNGKPVAFYSGKLQPAQTRYTTTERELLSIVETLKEFRNILLGQKIKVHTDHENLT
jgi:RNase H-like domain found in reverse transcriptase